jgi:high affinity Mn2+ porin
MRPKRRLKKLGATAAFAVAGVNLLHAGDASTNSTAGDTNSVVAPGTNELSVSSAPVQNWNWHVQNTDIVQGDPAFPAYYSGPNSLSNGGEVKETVSLDILAGLRLWQGAEAHVDGLMWQGFGLSKTEGVEAFPDGEAFRLGTSVPNVNITRLFIRQTIGFGGPQEDVADDELHLASRQDISRLTLTVGKFSAKDIFDNNSYANDPRSQFMSWGLMANEAWDYPADSIGFITGFAAELNQPWWTFRYGFFQMPKVSNGTALDQHFLEAWGMVMEYEQRWLLGSHPGNARLLGYLNQADMGSYAQALSVPGVDITQTRAYRHKYGFGLNLEQEIVTNLGVFSRIGWSDGRNEAWVFSDVDSAASLGLSLKGAGWNRPNDVYGLAYVVSGISREHEKFLEAGGTGILAGDGALNYALEESLETYYDFDVWKDVHFALDYQFVTNPAFNRDRGPVSVFAARLHWEF